MQSNKTICAKIKNGMMKKKALIIVLAIMAIVATALTIFALAGKKTNQTNEMENSKHMVTLETSLGNIKIETYDGDAPKAAENFVKLAREGFYDNVIFHRVIDGFMIQGGDPTGTGRGGPGYEFEDELNPETESYKRGYVKGAVAMANAGPNTNGSQFFILVADYPLPHDYTIFGRVIEGQEVADAIAKVQTDAGDRPIEDVIISKATVEDR
jgi:cyclophilin family peptidyl-prolyl cis-trans isomerase